MVSLRIWTVTFLMCWLVGTLAAAEANRPNILFIFADDQSYKTLGCYPESPKWVRTPNIDSLARSGVRFERAYLGSWCMPSRASLLTGRFPYGIESMRMEGEYPGSSYDPKQCPFVPAVLRANGYHTAQIGKWHTGTDSGWGRDWDYQIVWNRPKFPANAGSYYKEQNLTFNGVDKVVGGYSTDNYTEWAADYIRGKTRDPGKPWFLWLCYGAVHGPTTPAERHIGSYAGNEAPVPADIFEPRKGKPAYLSTTQSWTPDKTGKPMMLKRRVQQKVTFDKNEPGLGYNQWVQQVNECVRALDEGVGKVMQALRESGQLDNTFVVYSADQGFALGEHGFSHKLAPYDSNLASALIVSQPGKVPSGRVSKQTVNSPDLTATFCELAGIQVGWKLHGRSISPLLADPENAKFESPTMMMHLGHYYGSDTRVVPTGPELTEQAGVPWWLMIRDGRYKYVRTLVKGEMEELYDLEKDPEELNNLASAAEHQTLLARLRSRMAAELKRTDAPFLDSIGL